VAALHVFGTVGKSTTRIMVDAVLGSGAGALPAPVFVLLSPDADSAGQSWQQALPTLEADARVVVNADAVSAPATEASVTTFGLSDAATIRASDIDATLDGTAFTLTVGSEQRRVQLRVLGEHQVTNALAAISVARACGIPLEDSVAALERLATLGRGRMERLAAANDLVVINDTVSAAPQSVTAALKALTQVAGERRSVAVLGELSLGDEDPRAAHDRIGRLIVRLNVKKLVVVGHGARHIHNAAGLEGSWDGESVLLDSPREAYDFLREELRRQDVVLVKSSATAGLSDLANQLAEVTR
jgi:UDP-N-acetylmuramoyl-tripeptide--D-alanyl-D-alanine ligase